MAKTILVLGGTGLLGSHAARHLQKAGFSVRILARNMEKARRMFDDSFEIVSGDANNADTVCTALKGCYGAHISLSEVGDLQGTRNVTVCAHKFGLEHITYVSGATVDASHSWFPMIADKLQAEAAIRDTRLPYTIFCPSWFFEIAKNFIQEDRAIRIGKHAQPYHWLAADDFGHMVAQAYQTEAARNKRLYVLGPDVLLLDDVIKRICTRFYPHITSVQSIPVWMAKLMARLTRNPHMLAGSQLMGYFDKIGSVEALADPTEANALLGAPETTLDMWLDGQAQQCSPE